MNKVKPEKTKRVTKLQKSLLAIAVVIFLIGLIGTLESRKGETVKFERLPDNYWGVNWSPEVSNISTNVRY